MPIPFDISSTPQTAASEHLYKPLLAKLLKVRESEIERIVIKKRSIDARAKKAVVWLKGDLWLKGEPQQEKKTPLSYKNVENAERVIVVGAGPAGIFAALTLIKNGFKPIILERGKDVSERKKDIALVSRNNPPNTESNYCFGEGGAGTFSDGKLYTRSNKRGNVEEILDCFIQHGADPDIAVDAHPHIGTDCLPAIIKNMRNTIINYGGEYHFNTKCVDFIVKNNKVFGVIDQYGNNHEGIATVLATGHSASDIYELFDSKKWMITAKPFAIGVRVEHPQALINELIYHQSAKNAYLPTARYQLTTQAGSRGVYSFCMCPGGIIVPASTSEGLLVVNGMSNSKRNSDYANSGIVVSLEMSDFKAFEKEGALAALRFQQHIEHLMFDAGGASQTAPAQRMTDFLENKPSSSLQKTTYHPGVVSSPLHQLFPKFITESLQKGFKDFDRKLQGFITNEALLIAVESRTSSPVRIPRGDNYQHVQLENLYPCGEGAGYAGGIVSSAIDGVNCAERISK